MDKDPELSLLLTTKSVKRSYFAGKDISLLSESVFRQVAVNSRVGVAFTGHDDGGRDAENRPIIIYNTDMDNCCELPRVGLLIN